MKDNRFECGCERGGDCTKTTMCQVQSAIEDSEERIAELEAVIDDMNKHRDRVYPLTLADQTKRIAELEAIVESLVLRVDDVKERNIAPHRRAIGLKLYKQAKQALGGDDE
jgi:uncharacterized coiled-coil protein SlyX